MVCRVLSKDETIFMSSSSQSTQMTIKVASATLENSTKCYGDYKRSNGDKEEL